MSDSQADLKLFHLLYERMERIAADSIWAHRAIGVRGALLRQIEMNERNLTHDGGQVNALISNWLPYPGGIREQEKFTEAARFVKRCL